MLMRQLRSRSMAAQTASSLAPAPRSASRARITAFARGASISRIQPVVATIAGLVSVAGAAFSVVQFVRPANTGELVAIVQAAGSHRTVADATVEVLTTQNALIATLT